MSNFKKRQLAQESACEECGGTDDGGESFEAMEVAHEEVEQLTAEGVLLGEDTDTVMCADADTVATEEFAVVHESICNRWMIVHESSGGYGNPVVTGEGIVDTVKELFRKLIAWIKEVGAKVKARWAKLTSMAEHVKSKTDIYLKRIAELKTKEKDELKGQFIKSLTVSSKFMGNDNATISSSIAMISDLYKLQEARTDVTKKIIQDFLSKALDNPKAKMAELLRNAPRSEGGNYLGNKTLSVKDAPDEVPTYNLSWSDTDSAEVPDTVDTPSLPELRAVALHYQKFGKAMETYLRGRQKADRGYDDLIKSLLKIENGMSDLELGAGKKDKELLDACRRYAQSGITDINLYDTVTGHIVIALNKGLDGYIKESIKAYK